MVRGGGDEWQVGALSTAVLNKTAEAQIALEMYPRIWMACKHVM